MAAYQYESITAAQALAIGDGDTVAFAAGSARLYMASYALSAGNEVLSVSLSDGGPAVKFGPGFVALSQAGRVSFPDSSMLRIGGTGADSFVGGDGDDALFGGPGDDSLKGGAGGDLIQANMGRDYIEGGPGGDTIYGGQGDDLIYADASDTSSNLINFVQGNMGNDSITGSVGADTLLGGQDNDTINGLSAGGSDYIDGNLGNDMVFGLGTLLGEAGNDTLNGQSGADSISGGDGNDQITNVGGYVDGGAGADSIQFGFGVGGDSTVLGGDGADTITAPYLQNNFHGSVSGGAGDDFILGGAGGDTISGGSGADTIDGHGGGFDAGDMVSGGAGADLFMIAGGSINSVTGAPAGVESITDWDSGDRLHFTSYYGSLPPGTSGNYGETSAADYQSAFNAAKAMSAAQQYGYVAVQVGGDVVVFGIYLPNQTSGPAVILTGQSLANIDFQAFV